MSIAVIYDDKIGTYDPRSILFRSRFLLDSILRSQEFTVVRDRLVDSFKILRILTVLGNDDVNNSTAF